MSRNDHEKHHHQYNYHYPKNINNSNNNNFNASITEANSHPSTAAYDCNSGSSNSNNGGCDDGVDFYVVPTTYQEDLDQAYLKKHHHRHRHDYNNNNNNNNLSHHVDSSSSSTLSAPTSNVNGGTAAPSTGATTTSSPNQQQNVTANTSREYCLAKTFEHHAFRVNGLGYSPCGRFLVSSSEDNTLRLYDMVEGTACAGLDVERYGCEHAQFWQGEDYVVHSSRSANNFDLRAMCVTTQTYVGFYEGHTERVTSLAISPDQKMLASGAWDGTVRFWSAGYNGTLMLIPDLPHGRVMTAFDSTGFVFGFVDSTRRLRLYDVRALSSGPFARIALTKYHSAEEFCSLAFTHDHKHVVVGSVGDTTCVIDAMTGDLCHVLPQRRSSTNERCDVYQTRGLRAAVGPQVSGGGLVAQGTWDGAVRLWNASTGAVVQDVMGPSTSPNYVTAWNPRFDQLVTASTAVHVFHPKQP